MRTFLPIVLIALALALFFGYVNPAYSGGIAAARADIASDNQSLSTLTQYTSRENQLLAAQQQISPADLAIVEEILPTSVNNVQTILDLDTLAQSSGLALSSVDVENQAAAGGSAVGGVPAAGAVNSVDLDLSASGTYGAFRTFLSGVEHSARILDVETLSVKGSSTGVYSYNIDVRLYWLD